MCLHLREKFSTVYLKGNTANQALSRKNNLLRAIEIFAFYEEWFLITGISLYFWKMQVRKVLRTHCYAHPFKQFIF